MSEQFWNQVKSKSRLGKLIHGKVEHHAPFGIFVNIGDDTVRGIVQITDFVDNGDMMPEMYSDNRLWQHLRDYGFVFRRF